MAAGPIAGDWRDSSRIANVFRNETEIQSQSSKPNLKSYMEIEKQYYFINYLMKGR